MLRPTESTVRHKLDNGTMSDFYPTGPYLRLVVRDDAFDIAEEDFLLPLKQSTARAYKADLQDFYEWCERDGLDPLRPDPSEVRRYVAALPARGYAETTTRRRAQVVKRFVRHVEARDRSSSSAPTTPQVGGEHVR